MSAIKRRPFERRRDEQVLAFGMPLTAFGMRTTNCLLRAGYHTPADLVGVPWADLAAIRGLGAGGLELLREARAPLPIDWT